LFRVDCNTLGYVTDVADNVLLQSYVTSNVPHTRWAKTSAVTGFSTNHV